MNRWCIFCYQDGRRNVPATKRVDGDPVCDVHAKLQTEDGTVEAVEPVAPPKGKKDWGYPISDAVKAKIQAAPETSSSADLAVIFGLKTQTVAAIRRKTRYKAEPDLPAAIVPKVEDVVFVQQSFVNAEDELIANAGYASTVLSAAEEEQVEAAIEDFPVEWPARFEVHDVEEVRVPIDAAPLSGLSFVRIEFELDVTPLLADKLWESMSLEEKAHAIRETLERRIVAL